MTKFTFSLEPVLDHRKRIEVERQHVVAARLRELGEATARLMELNEEFLRRTDVLRSDHRELVAEELRLHYAHLDYLDRARSVQLCVVDECRADLERARSELAEARKQHKIVDKLRSRRHDAHVAEQTRTEEYELDDGNARRHSGS